MKKIRVMLADDHSVVRSGLLRVLENQENIILAGEAISGEQAYQLFTKLKPCVLVMNIIMSGMGGLEALRRILTRDSEAKIIMFSMDDNVTFATQALTMGAVGYISMSEEHNNLIDTIVGVVAGKKFLSAEMAQKMALQSTSGDDNIVQKLTTREFEIFRLIVEGKSVESIAKWLKISQKTVANYQTVLKHKLGVSSPVELVRLAMKHGVIES